MRKLILGGMSRSCRSVPCWSSRRLDASQEASGLRSDLRFDGAAGRGKRAGGQSRHAGRRWRSAACSSGIRSSAAGRTWPVRHLSSPAFRLRRESRSVDRRRRQSDSARRVTFGRSAIPFVKRNSQTILNAVFNGISDGGAYEPSTAPMFWDLRARSLELQALEPLKTLEEMRGDALPRQTPSRP